MREVLEEVVPKKQLQLKQLVNHSLHTFIGPDADWHFRKPRMGKPFLVTSRYAFLLTEGSSSNECIL